MSTIFKVDASEIIQLEKDLAGIVLDKDLKPDFNDFMTEYLNDVRVEAPRKSGRLANSVTVNTTSGGLEGTLATGSNCPYAPFVYTGTKAHTVESNGKALNIPGIGFRHSANIPAKSANPYIEKTFTKHQTDYMGKLETEFAITIEDKL